MEHAAHNSNIDEVCEQLARLFDAGDKEVLLATVRHLLSATLHDIDVLGARVAELLKKLYGRKSERFDPNQLDWMFPVPAVPPTEPPEDAAPAVETAPAPRRRRTGGRGQGSLPAHLPRHEIRLQPTEEQLAATSGKMSPWREERSEVLEYEPARFHVLVYVREVWSNAQGEVVTAPAPVKVIDKGLPGPKLLVQVMLSKYRDHCPLTRQVAIYQRLGVDLSRNTLVDWIAAVANLLEPLAHRIRALVLTSHVLQADDTKLKVQDRRTAQNIKSGRLWALVGDHFYVAYHYAEDWRAETTFALLGERQGWLQVDGYKGYERVFAQGKAVEVGCWMHARRYFVRAFEAKDLRAARPLALIRDLYAVERAAKEAGESPEARQQRRQRDSKPILDALENWIDEHGGQEPPTSLLSKAMTYATNQWQALRRPLEDGRLEIDNGDVERAIRGLAIGRRNWLFAGSDEGAHRAAILCTVLESAARHELELQLYLHDVLMKLAASWPQARLDELLPHRWRALHAAAAQAAARASPLGEAG